MSNQIQKLSNRILAMALAVILIVGMLPVSVFAATPSTVVTDIGDKMVIVGESVEFTVTTTANDDAGKMVFGYFNFNGGDWSVIESLQYKESGDGNWYDLPQNAPFGPPGTGFPMSDATSTFRVTFKTTGIYSFDVSMKTVEDGIELCSLSQQVTVSVKPSEIITDITEKEFVVGTSAEFSFTSIPNGHAGEMVFGKFTFSDWDAVEKLEYWGVTENMWLTLPKDVLFGPADTGFPMTEATTRLRVTFNKAGTYTCSVALVKASDTDTVLSSIESEITVTERIRPVVDSITGNPESWAQSATITGSVSDQGGSGVMKVVYSTENNYNVSLPTADLLADGTFSFSVAENATYYVWAVDGDGNFSTEAKSIVIDKIDTTPPVLKVVPDPAWINDVGAEVTVTITAQDANGVTVMFNNSGSFDDAEVLAQTDDNAEISKDIAVSAGTYYVWAVDTAGNKTAKSIAVQCDTTAPAVDSISADPNTWTNQTVTVSCTVSDNASDNTSDNASGVAKVVYSTSDTFGTDLPEADLKDDGTYSFDVSDEYNGKYYVWAVDNAGNVSDVADVQIQIDTTAPAVDSISADPNTWTNQPVTVSCTVSDNASGVAKVVYSTSDTFGTDLPEADLKDDGTYSFDVSDEYNGKYYVWAVDNAGNESDAAEVQIQIDTTAPAVDSISADPNTWTNQPVTVSCTVSDNASGVAKVVYSTSDAFKVDLPAATLNGDETYSFDVSDEYNGKYYVWVVDNAGNESDAAEVQIQIDTTAPTAKITIGKGFWESFLEKITFGIYHSDKVTVEIEADDKSSGVESESVQYFISATPLTKEDVKNATEWKRYTGSFDISDQQNLIVYVRVTDNAGNTEYFSSDGVILDKSSVTITLKPSADNGVENVYGFYNGNVKVDISVSVVDGKPYSGIKTIEYWVTRDDEETRREILYSFGYDGSYDPTKNWEIIGSDVETENGSYTGIPTQDMLKNSWKGAIIVDADTNNSSNVVVTVQVTDNAGNVYPEAIKLDIDKTRPTVKVDYDDHEGIQHNGWYYNDVRTATITVTERSDHFVEPTLFINQDVPEGETNYIHITAVDANGKQVDFAPTIEWIPAIHQTDADKTAYTAQIAYNVDANYTFEIKIMDKAMNTNDGIDTNTQDNPYRFAVDKEMPNGSVTIKTTASSETWDKILEVLTFGLYDATHIDVTATANDATSPVKVEYYKATGAAAATVLTVKELDALTGWTLLADNGECVVDSTDVLTVKDYEQFVIYLKLTDYAGNTQYICSGGAILDNKNPEVEKVEPQITVTPSQQPVNGIYNTDVLIDVAVKEIAVEGVYSGLKSVTYEVYNRSISSAEPTQTGTLLDFTNKTPAQAELIPSYEEQGAIKVEKDKNNSNEVEVKVIAVDNAGNRSEKSIFIKIDITAPTIDISYNNNNPDSGSYYNGDRVATIKITERNFNADDVKITITNTDGIIPTIPTSISDWTEVVGTENLDNTTYVATIRYSADGDYKFDIAYTDLAANPCAGATFAAGTQNATEFTIDQTNPVIRVSYNNNDAANEKYFNASRTATITITEHNFDVNRVTFTQTAGRGGVTPNVSWANNGDIHIATISYTVDGDYTFDVTMTDKAGNKSGAADYGTSVAGKDFVIDTTFEDMITIGGVKNGKAYGYSDDIIPTIDITDINLEKYTISLIGVQKDTTIDLTDKVNALLKVGAENVTGTLDIYKVAQEMDGIYTLTVTAQDKAGNQDSEEITFTVNRFGSVYVYDQYLLDLIADGGAYVMSITDDLVIVEYNADKLVSDSLMIEITCDGKPLENVIYEVTPEINDSVAVGESGWYQYKYTISKDNFTSDGVYKISISSKDATGNSPENNSYEDLGITFRVDSTPAEITSIIGLEKAIINATDVTVKYTVFDTMGIKSIKVYVDGNMVDEITDFSADLNNYTGSFVLTEQTSAQSVRIVVEDMSGNITDTDAEDFSSAYDFNKSVTVSTNIFVRWYANKPLFWGSIGGVVVLAAAVGVLIAKRKKKVAA